MDGFSLLMSVYARECPENLELAFRSILIEQTKIPNEFVLVCDGPLTDELDAIIDAYQKEYDILKVFRFENNQGLGRALNFGLSKCTYDLVARADSDDICAKDRFDVQISYMDSHPDISIISSYIDEFNDDWTRPVSVKKVPLCHDELVSMAKSRNPLNHMAVMFRKSDIMEIGSYRHVPCVEDYDLWIRAIIQGKKLANIDRVLVHARIGNGMAGRRGNKQYIKSWKVLNQYMYDNHMIGKLTMLKNMTAIRLFVYMPSSLKEFVYRNILRK